ncbi:aspartyl-phosphate phosphatase Spo0E family protein [Bacillus thuringiensis]
MRHFVKVYEYTDRIVLTCSQELDTFVYLFMRDYSTRTVEVNYPPLNVLTDCLKWGLLG